MQTGKQRAKRCKSVFKGATEEAIAKAFTQRWIELMNRLERQKSAGAARLR